MLIDYAYNMQITFERCWTFVSAVVTSPTSWPCAKTIAEAAGGSTTSATFSAVSDATRRDLFLSPSVATACSAFCTIPTLMRLVG